MSATADVLADREATIRAYYARADAGIEFGDIKGLGKIIVGTEIEPANLVAYRITGGQNHHWNG